jgi:hypothetical protein
MWNIEQKGNLSLSRDRTMPRFMRDMLSLASCGGFVWVVWSLAFSVTSV